MRLMGLLVTGRVERINEREAGNPGQTWIEQTLVVQDWGQTLFLTVGRDFGSLPEEGEHVAVNVALRPFKRKDDSLGVGYTALSRCSDVTLRGPYATDGSGPVAAAS